MTASPTGFEAVSQGRTEVGLITQYVDGTTGLRHVHVSTSDPHLVVALALRTPTPGRAGLPHILEHWIGSGSRLFPARHLFPALLTRTAASFLNAFTGPDHTSFVAATTCPASAELLTDALVDGVFHPLLRDEDFAEEAWGVDTTGDGIGGFGGVVWQEAVTRLDDPQTLAALALASSLYEPPALRSLQAQGLQPLDLIGVTPDEVRAYHAQQYHPDRAWLITMGDLPAEWFQGRTSRLLEARARTAPGPLSELRFPATEMTSVAGAGGPGAVDALIGVRLESTATAGAPARAKVLQGLLATTRTGSLPAALKACGATRYAVGSGVHTMYPHTILGVGVGTDTLDEAERAHRVLTDALPSAFRGDDVRAAARRALLDARDRAHLPHPAPVWAVQRVLDAVGPLVHGADPVAAFDVEGHLREQLDEPEHVLTLLARACDRVGRVVVDHTRPTAREEFDAAMAVVPVPAVAPITARHLPVVPPLIPAKDLAPRAVPAHPVRLGDALWSWHTETDTGVSHTVVDVDLTGLALDLLPVVRLLAVPLNCGQAWRSRTEIVVEAHPDDIDRPRVWLRMSLTSHHDDTDAAHAWLVRSFESMRDDPTRWAVSSLRGLRSGLATAAGPPLLRSATAAQVSGAGVAQDFADGLAGRSHLHSLIGDQAAARALFTTGVEQLVRMPRTVVLTRPEGAPRSGEALWGTFTDTGAGAAGDPPAVAPAPGEPVSVRSPGGPAVVVTYRAVAPAHHDAAADLVLAGVLDRRLYRAVRALSAHGSKASLSWSTGTLTFGAAGTDRLDDALTAIRAVLRDVVARPPDEDELSAARPAAVSGLSRMPSVHDQAANAVHDSTTGGEVVRAKLTGSVHRVGRDSVVEAARRYRTGPPPAVGASGHLSTTTTTTQEHP